MFHLNSSEAPHFFTYFAFLVGMNKNSSYHVLLAAYTWGKDASRHSGLSDESVFDECFTGLARIHRRSVEYVRRQVSAINCRCQDDAFNGPA